MSDKTCVICRKPDTFNTLCLDCYNSYANTAGLDMFGVIAWAVNRARYFDARSKR